MLRFKNAREPRHVLRRIADYYPYYFERLEAEARKKSTETKDEIADVDVSFERGIISVLCSGQDMPAVYHWNAIDKDEAARIERRAEGLKNKGQRFVIDLKRLVPDARSEEFWRRRKIKEGWSAWLRFCTWCFYILAFSFSWLQIACVDDGLFH